MNSTMDDNNLLCSKEKGEVVMANKERRLSSETNSHGQFISKRAVPALVVTLIESSEIDDSSLNEPHMLSLCDSCGDDTGQNASSSPVNTNDTNDAFIDMETGMVEEGMEQEARLTSYSHDCHGQYRSGAFVVTDLDGGGSNDGCDNQTANTSFVESYDCC
jgi:hypothetical protein